MFVSSFFDGVFCVVASVKVSVIVAFPGYLCNYIINPISRKFLNWMLPSLSLDTFIFAKQRFQSNINNKIVSSVDPNETALSLHWSRKSYFTCAGYMSIWILNLI